MQGYKDPPTNLDINDATLPESLLLTDVMGSIKRHPTTHQLDRLLITSGKSSVLLTMHPSLCILQFPSLTSFLDCYFIATKVWELSHYF